MITSRIVRIGYIVRAGDAICTRLSLEVDAHDTYTGIMLFIKGVRVPLLHGSG